MATYGRFHPEAIDWRDEPTPIDPRLIGRRKPQRCPDCGAEGELAGHMECQYPQDRP